MRDYEANWETRIKQLDDVLLGRNYLWVDLNLLKSLEVLNFIHRDNFGLFFLVHISEKKKQLLYVTVLSSLAYY